MEHLFFLSRSLSLQEQKKGKLPSGLFLQSCSFLSNASLLISFLLALLCSPSDLWELWVSRQSVGLGTSCSKIDRCCSQRVSFGELQLSSNILYSQYYSDCTFVYPVDNTILFLNNQSQLEYFIFIHPGFSFKAIFRRFCTSWLKFASAFRYLGKLSKPCAYNLVNQRQ